MEISKGMYIRFNGFISKIGHINTSQKGNTYVQFKQPNGLLAHTRIENIDKASFNIIDLIEVGDYVNGYKVSEIIIDKDISDNDKLKFGDDDLVLTFKSNHDTYYLYIEDIEDIITKEQFNSMKYVVERDK